MNNFYYNNKPYSKELQDYFYFLPSDLTVSEKLYKLLKEREGVYLLYGFRGNGKTSIVNYTIENLRKNLNNKVSKIINIKINSFNGEKDFYRQLLNGLNTNFNELLNNYDKLSNEYLYQNNVCKISEIVRNISETWEYGDKLPDVFDNIQNNIKGNMKSDLDKNKLYPVVNDFKTVVELILNLFNVYRYYDWDETKTYENKDNKFNKKTNSLGVGIDLKKKFAIFANFGHKSEEATSKSKENSFVRSLNITYEDKKRNILSLLAEINKIFKVNIIVDEMDKVNKDEILDFLNKNKTLYYDSGSTLILISDIGTKFFLEKRCDYINDNSYLLMKSLDFVDYLVLSKYLGNINGNFFSYIDKYFKSKLSKREAIHNYENKLDIKYKYPGIALFKFINSSFYQSLKLDYQEVFARFYIELLDFVIKIGSITEEDFNKFRNDFVNNYDINFLEVKKYFEQFKVALMHNDLKYDFNYVKFADRKSYDEELNNNINNFFDYLIEYDNYNKYYLSWNGDNIVYNSNNHTDIKSNMTQMFDFDFIENIPDEIILCYFEEDLSYNDKKWSVEFHRLDLFEEFNNKIDRFFMRVLFVELFERPGEIVDTLLNGAIFIYNSNFNKIDVYYSIGYPGLDSHNFTQSKKDIIEKLEKYRLKFDIKTKDDEEIDKPNNYIGSEQIFDFLKNCEYKGHRSQKKFVNDILEEYE